MEIIISETEDTRVLIRDHLQNNGIKVVWLASKIGISSPHLLNILAQKRNLLDKYLQKINETLKTNF